MNWLFTGAITFAVVAYSAYILSKTRHPKRKFRMSTIPVFILLRPVNFLYDIFYAALGVKIIKPQRQKFIDQAKDIAKNTDVQLFGPQENFVKGVELFIDGLVKAQTFSGTGTILFNGFCQRMLNARKNVINYIQANPDKLKPLVRPIIISGLPRTGSTMLYNLLSCDPEARTPRFFEMSHMANPTPPITEATKDTDPRINEVHKRFDETEKLFPGMWTEAGKSHRSHPNEIEEDLLLLLQGFLMQIHIPYIDEKYTDWYNNEDDKDFAYRYHQLFFQLLNHAWTPKSHWALKAPIHTTYLDALLKFYPDARLVFTHREPSTVVPSWGRLLESYVHWTFQPFSVDLVEYGRKNLRNLVLMSERLLVFRKKLKQEQFFDVDYNVFIKNPIGMIESMYNHFGLQVSDEFRENMKKWITENRQGKYGRREYSLADYNQTEEEVNKAFTNYNAVFFPHLVK